MYFGVEEFLLSVHIGPRTNLKCRVRVLAKTSAAEADEPCMLWEQKARALACNPVGPSDTFCSSIWSWPYGRLHLTASSTLLVSWAVLGNIFCGREHRKGTMFCHSLVGINGYVGITSERIWPLPFSCWLMWANTAFWSTFPQLQQLTLQPGHAVLQRQLYFLEEQNMKVSWEQSPSLLSLVLCSKL